MKKTQWLMAGLLTGAMALGAGCMTDKASTRGTGGSGPSVDQTDNRPRGEGMTPMPEEDGIREMEPSVHEEPLGDPPPGTGGAGLEESPLDRQNQPMEPVIPSTPAPHEGMAPDVGPVH